MHETRNFVVTVCFIGALLWAIAAWLVMPGFMPSVELGVWQKVTSLVLAAGIAVWLYWIYHFTDPFDDQLARVTSDGRYFEADGLCFMPIVRMNGDRAEISLYYQSRFSNPVEAVIHLRPPEHTFGTHARARDIAIAFRARPGAFGVVHQPIAVARSAQGRQIKVELAAATRWPRNHGEQLRTKQGRACGTFRLDWALAYRLTEHELNGEMELIEPAVIELWMPTGVEAHYPRNHESSQETISCAEA